jgi:tetrahydromethanopterin S-methyltransferase subunit H
MIFSGPMGGAGRILPAVAEAEAFLAVAKFGETKKLPKCSTHPIYKLFPDFVEQMKGL